jgi:hypothetical protein
VNVLLYMELLGCLRKKRTVAWTMKAFRPEWLTYQTNIDFVHA